MKNTYMLSEKCKRVVRTNKGLVIADIMVWEESTWMKTQSSIICETRHLVAMVNILNGIMGEEMV